MKHDALTMALLYDYYGELLTEKQRTCFDLYYNQDLSLSEIAEDLGVALPRDAEDLGVTRQGVHDTLARAEAQLRDFEEKTGCIAREEAVRAACGQIGSAAHALLNVPGAEEAARQILAAVDKLKE